MLYYGSNLFEAMEFPMNYRVLSIESEEGFSVNCPAMKGCHSQSATREEALANIQDVIREWLDAEKEISSIWQ
jgi:predicted RNase H-like HicB family nuclease